MRKSSPNFFFALLLLLTFSQYTHACLERIDQALGANPSFFNMSNPMNMGVYTQNISADEKFYYLIHNSFEESQLFSEMRNYNLLLPFSCPPNGTVVVDKTYIHSAWVRVITVMPSVTDENGVEWSLPEGELLAAGNYSLLLPRSATNLYPDCGTVYTLLNETERLSVYANDAYLGSSKLVSYETNSTNLDVRAELFASVNIRKDYYSPVCRCCKSGKNGCEATCCSCEFSSSEAEEENVAPNDSVERKVYRLNATPELTMLSCPDDPLMTASGNLSMKSNVPLQSLLLSFTDSNITLHTHRLDLNVIIKPHNVLEARAIPEMDALSQNMYSDQYSILNNNIMLNFTEVQPEDVRIHHAGLVLTDIFGIPHDMTDYTRINCPLNPQIELSIPRWAQEGSDFPAVIKLSDNGTGIQKKKVSVCYSGEEHSGFTDSNGEVTIPLRANQSLVEAISEYDGAYAEVSTKKNLMVYASSSATYALSFLAFLFILALSYIAFVLITRRGK